MEYLEALEEWQSLGPKIKQLQARERELRNLLFEGTFPNPKEGTNTYNLPDGRIIKGTYKLSRSVDEAALPAVLEQLPEGLGDRLVQFKPSLVLSEYRKLPDDQRKIFDQALITKPGSPTLEVTNG